MVIKDRFRLIGNTPNILSLSDGELKAFYNDENSPRHVFAFLELKHKSISHFTTPTIFSFISDINRREQLKVINFDYPLHASYNERSKNMIVNLKPFEVSEISSLNPNDLYAAITYAYLFTKLITNKAKISESYISVIVNFWLSLYVKAFGRKFGLVGIYSAGIPKLKFMVACYILAAYFGNNNDLNLFSKAARIAPYMYNNEVEQLKKYDFSKIDDFIKCVSDLKVMPGLTLAQFTSVMYRYYGINLLAGIEDCSRFFSLILTSSIPGQKVAPKHLVQVNEKNYYTLVDVCRRMF